MLKTHYFSIFFKKFNKQYVNFSRVWTKNANCWETEKIFKIFDENSIEKLNFYFYFGKFVTKNSAFENNTIFLPQFFWFRGGGFSPSPWLRPCSIATLFWSEKMFDVKKVWRKKSLTFSSNVKLVKLFFTSNYFRYTVYSELKYDWDEMNRRVNFNRQINLVKNYWSKKSVFETSQKSSSVSQSFYFVNNFPV